VDYHVSVAVKNKASQQAKENWSVVRHRLSFEEAIELHCHNYLPVTSVLPIRLNFHAWLDIRNKNGYGKQYVDLY